MLLARYLPTNALYLPIYARRSRSPSCVVACIPPISSDTPPIPIRHYHFVRIKTTRLPDPLPTNIYLPTYLPTYLPIHFTVVNISLRASWSDDPQPVSLFVVLVVPLYIAEFQPGGKSCSLRGPVCLANERWVTVGNFCARGSGYNGTLITRSCSFLNTCHSHLTLITLRDLPLCTPYRKLCWPRKRHLDRIIKLAFFVRFFFSFSLFCFSLTMPENENLFNSRFEFIWIFKRLLYSCKQRNLV